MRNQTREGMAIAAANYVISKCPELEDEQNSIGLILGTGWGNVLKITDPLEIPLSEIHGFSNLEKLEGHKRSLIIGHVAGKRVLALSGRIHLNEAPSDPDIPKMVRLQVEMLFKLGVKRLIATAAVGSLHEDILVGGITAIDHFVSMYAPDMPLWAGEFVSPDSVLDNDLLVLAIKQKRSLNVWRVAHAMVRGPQFEGPLDKKLLFKSGASVVGMSIYPEACIAALYGVKMLALCFVTNTAFGVHSHEQNVARAQESSGLLGQYLTNIIDKM